MLDNKYYEKRFKARSIQQISGLGTFIDNIESIDQDGCMTEESFAKSSSASYDRSLDTLALIRTQLHSEPLQFLDPGGYADKQAVQLAFKRLTL